MRAEFLLAALLLLPVWSHACDRTAVEVNLPPGDLLTALDRLRHLVDVNSLYRTNEINAYAPFVHSRGLHGRYTPARAFEALFKGTQLEAVWAYPCGVVIARVPPPQVLPTLTIRAPRPPCVCQVTPSGILLAPICESEHRLLFRADLCGPSVPPLEESPHE